ncbi:hypothetical protein AWH69_12960 [Janibacter melonis]|uniref:Uncharacterized protein n=1 Tax=Janibacter melonis TaxID=262209 RepID=A0A176QC32_9MICO|nr:hypothetical protein [Janibacter melonis]OAB87245.1 hypothetical protein AWH69_12960 [Janibacter melonis]
MSSHPVPGPPTPRPPGVPSPADIAPPGEGDAAVDAALAELDAADPADLDAVLSSAESVLATLQHRLRDIGD